MSLNPSYRHIQKLLIVSSSWLGDAVITVPTIYGIRSIFPKAHAAILAKDTIADIFRAVPVIDEIIPYAKRKGFGKIDSHLHTARMLKKKKFDLAILFPRSLGTALMCLAARIPCRVGFTDPLRSLLLTEKLERSSEVLTVHQVYYYKKLLEPLGQAQFPEMSYLVVPDAERTWARTFMRANNLDPSEYIIGLNPGSTYGKAKQWLPERFQELAQRLIAKQGCRIILFGDSATSMLAAAIDKQLGGRAVNTVGRTNTLQLAALLERCSILVTNDTGPMHVACALGTPVVAVFGSTDQAATGPLGPHATAVNSSLPCSPCLKRTCPKGHYRCMHAVTVDTVEAAVLEQLKKPR